MRWTLKDEMITNYSISGDCSDAFAFDATEVDSGGREADDHFVIQPTYNRDDDGPVVVQEVLISKVDDKSLSGEDDAFIVDGADQTAGAHTGGCQPVLYDGSVRLIGTSDAIATSDFFLV